MKAQLKTSLVLVAALIVAVGGSFLASRFYRHAQPAERGNRQNRKPGVATITDQTGKNLHLQVPAERIVSCYTAFAQMLSAVGAENHIVGATRQQAKKLDVQSVGTHMKPSIEAIVSCRPDVVIVSSHRQKVIASLRKTLASTDASVLAVHPESVSETLELIETLGRLTGNHAPALNLVRSAENRLKRITRNVERIPKTERKEVFFEVRGTPSLLTCGRNSVAYDVIQLAGGRPVCDTPKSVVHIDVERVVDAAPDAYIQQAGVMNRNPKHPSKRPVLGRLDCVANGRFLKVREKRISRPGLQLIGTVKKIYDFLYKPAEPKETAD